MMSLWCQTSETRSGRMEVQAFLADPRKLAAIGQRIDAVQDKQVQVRKTIEQRPEFGAGSSRLLHAFTLSFSIERKTSTAIEATWPGRLARGPRQYQPRRSWHSATSYQSQYAP